VKRALCLGISAAIAAFCTGANAQTDADDITRCAALYHVELDSPSGDGPFYLTVSGSELPYAFYSEAFLAMGRDQTALNDRINELVPFFRDVRSTFVLAQQTGDVTGGSKQWPVERGRCEALGATLELTRPFFWVRKDMAVDLFPLPGNAEQDLEAVNYALGWYGGSCVGFTLANRRVQRELQLDLDLPKQDQPVFVALKEVADLATGWREDDLLLHIQAQTSQFSAAARIILPLNAAKETLPEQELSIMRTGQSNCQQFALFKNQKAVLMARDQTP
jgi:hypothetical protein